MNQASARIDFVPEPDVKDAVLVVCTNCQTDNVVRLSPAGHENATCEVCGYDLSLS